jgi:hypothetical protein
MSRTEKTNMQFMRREREEEEKNPTNNKPSTCH